ncbi:hypothetical protein PY365_20165 [Roseiarcaceae bacterium H3SJ34-1]|uniref:hypothetical protein n=1 Tax=Terripilifer ovatus TaxID=3032367 RepID=UPI003AB989FA|nr:hypothetical protein [Roseiarcaceae bacterium H3SJ34-1]
MRKHLGPSLVLISLGIGITSMALAQDAGSAQPAAPAQQGALADHGTMSGDMSMMRRMNKMMDACEKMMQSNDRRDRKGRRG